MPPRYHQPLSPAAARVTAATTDPGCSFDPGTATDLPATAVAIQETNGLRVDGDDYSTVFKGMRITLSPLLSREEEEAASEIVTRGSGIVTKKKAASSAYIVCPAAPTREERAILNSAPESRGGGTSPATGWRYPASSDMSFLSTVTAAATPPVDRCPATRRSTPCMDSGSAPPSMTRTSSRR